MTKVYVSTDVVDAELKKLAALWKTKGDTMTDMEIDIELSKAMHAILLQVDTGVGNLQEYADTVRAALAAM